MNKGQQRSKAKFDILERIRQERDKRGWSDYELSKNSQLTQSTISTWFSKKIEPGIASLEKVCEGLGISLAQLFQTDDPVFLSDEQERFLELFDCCSKQQRKAILELLNSFLE